MIQKNKELKKFTLQNIWGEIKVLIFHAKKKIMVLKMYFFVFAQDNEVYQTIHFYLF